MNFLEFHESSDVIRMVARKKTLGKELDLVMDYIEFRKTSFKPTSTKQLAIFVEPKIASYYPDIVFVEYNPNTYENWSANRFELKQSTLKILYHIHSTKGLSFSDITSQLGVSWRDAALAIEELHDSKLLKRENRIWTLVDKSSTSIKKIEAVEAKLYKWDVVLQQAMVNKNFASESYALSKSERIPKDGIIQDFERLGVGLRVQSRDGFKTLGDAKRTKIPVSFYSLYFNEWIGRTLISPERKL